MKKIINKVTFYYESSNIEESVLNDFFYIFKKDFSNINSFFDITCTPQIPIYIVTKTELDIFVKNTSSQYKNCDVPKWLDGFSTSKSIHILTPNSDNMNGMVKVALHETVHFIIYQMELEQPPLKVLDEGLAIYLSQQNTSKSFNLIVNEYLANQLKNLSDFCIYDTIKFAQLKGYQYSYYITEFLILNYSKNDYINWLKNPNNFLKRLPSLDIKFRDHITKIITLAIEKKLKKKT